MPIYKFPRELTPAVFLELSKSWNLSSYGKTKPVVQNVVREFFKETKVRNYFNQAMIEKHEVVEDNDINVRINSVFEAVQRWGGKTGMRKKNEWLVASKLPYLKYMIHATDCKSLLEIPNIAFNLASDTRGLGLSFATKHLKFASDLAVVFDSRIVSATGLKNSKDGFSDFLLACQHKSLELTENGYGLSLPEVEEAFFQSTG